MNLLLHLTPTPDYPTWKRDFDAHAETRRTAGLTLLQLWRGADDASVTALFEVNDRARAQAWLEREDQTAGPVTGRFLRTA